MNRRKDMPKARRLFAPRIERLENREVLTSPLLLAGPVSQAKSFATQLAALDPSNAPPTRHEQHREAFSARFRGGFTTGPGRFTDQASQTYLAGGGNSSMFLHGDVQLGF